MEVYGAAMAGTTFISNAVLTPVVCIGTRERSLSNWPGIGSGKHFVKQSPSCSGLGLELGLIRLLKYLFA